MLERSDADRVALIGRLHVRDDAVWLAELLMGLKDEVGEIARLRLADALRWELGLRLARRLTNAATWTTRTTYQVARRRGARAWTRRTRTHGSHGAG